MIDSARPVAIHTFEMSKRVLLASLQKFYAKPEHFAVLECIVASSRKSARSLDEEEEEIEGERHKYAGISLRVIDHYLSEYSSARNVHYAVDGSELPFFVAHAYQQTLRNHGKNNFDAFARNSRDVIRCEGREVQTTCGQANVLRWAIQHHVLDDIAEHVADVRSHLKASTRDRAARKAREAKAMLKPVGIKKTRKVDKKQARHMRVAPVCYSHHADRPVYKYKFAF